MNNKFESTYQNIFNDENIDMGALIKEFNTLNNNEVDMYGNTIEKE